MNNTGTVSNYGVTTGTINGGSVVNKTKTVDTNEQANMNATLVDVLLTNETGALVSGNMTGVSSVDNDGTMTGTINITGDITNDEKGSITNGIAGATNLTNSGAIEKDVVVTGDITNEVGSTMDGAGTITAGGDFINKGTINVKDGAHITVDTFYAYGTIDGNSVETFVNHLVIEDEAARMGNTALDEITLKKLTINADYSNTSSDGTFIFNNTGVN